MFPLDSVRVYVFLQLTWQISTAFRLEGGSDGEESACNAGDAGSIPRWGRSPGEGNDNPLLYSCLEKSMDRGVWWVTVSGVVKSWTRLSD